MIYSLVIIVIGILLLIWLAASRNSKKSDSNSFNSRNKNSLQE